LLRSVYPEREPINTLAARNGVSRPTVYRQMNRADVALDELFSSAATRDDVIARTHDVAADLVRATCVLRRKSETSSAFWQGWLALLQFVFNHRRFVRSRCAKRIGRSPRELMSGQPHKHWLTLLGFGPLQPRQT
jgi:hypothetical protein